MTKSDINFSNKIALYRQELSRTRNYLIMSLASLLKKVLPGEHARMSAAGADGKWRALLFAMWIDRFYQTWRVS